MNTFHLLLVVGSVLLAIQAAYSLGLMLFAWEDKNKGDRNRAVLTFEPPSLRFTILLPARHEEAVIQDTIQRMVDLNYPRDMVQVLVVIDAGDIGTISAVREKLAALNRQGINNVRLLTFADLPISKPHGLNVGLREATGDVVTIFDAEDEPHPVILHLVNSVMLRESTPVVQCGVQLMNYADHWFSALNVLEYFFWFKSRMHYHAAVGMAPLGGNTVFITREWLESLGGWDENCLTEDADIGIRLSAAGVPIRIIYDDEFVTREETPTTTEQFVRQRTRWHQGFLQVLLKGDWLRLPTLGQRLFALYTLGFPLFNALIMLYLPVSLWMMFAVKLPDVVAMVTTLPAYMVLGQFLISVVGLYEFAGAHKLRPSLTSVPRMLIAYLPYQWMLSYAAVRATWRQLRGLNNWEKTAHVGAHRISGLAHSTVLSASSPVLATSPQRVTGGSSGMASFTLGPNVSFVENERTNGKSIARGPSVALSPARHGTGSNGVLNRRQADSQSAVWHPSGSATVGVAERPKYKGGSRNESTTDGGFVERVDAKTFARWCLKNSGAIGFQLFERIRTRVLAPNTALVLVLMTIGLLSQGLNVWGYPSITHFDDEGTYVADAWALLRMGQLSHYTYTYGHVPGAWMLVAAWMMVTGGVQAFGMPVDSARLLMLVLHVAMVPLLFRLARKLGASSAAASIAAFLFSVSPLAVFYQRVFLLDNVMIFWILVSLNLLLDDKARLSRFVLSGIAYGLALLSKETAIFVLPAVLLMVVLWRRPHHGRFAIVGWVLPMAIVTSWYPLYAIIKGELLPAGLALHLLGFTLAFDTGPHVSLLDSLLWQVGRGGGSVTSAGSQFWFNVYNVWMPQDRLLLVGGGAAIALNLLRGIRSRGALAASALGLAATYYLVRGGIVFEFYILLVIPFLCLNIALLLSPLVTPLVARLRPRQAIALGASAGVALLVFYWNAGTLQPLYAQDPSKDAQAALVWVKHNVPSQSVIITRDTLWTPLREHGLGGPAFPNVQNHWQVATDPAVRYGILHNDWHNVDYLLIMPDLVQQFRSSNDTVALDALDNAKLVKSWYVDNDTIELWKVDKSGAIHQENLSVNESDRWLVNAANDVSLLSPAPASAASAPAVKAPATPAPAAPVLSTQVPETRVPATQVPATQALVAPSPALPSDSRSVGLDGIALPRVYVVQPGDTLKSIAIRVYGDPNALRSITLANGQPIADPNSLSPGEQLALPRRQP